MTKHRNVFPFRMNLGSGAPAAKAFDITNFDDSSLYNFCEEDILRKNQAADTIATNDQKPVSFNVNDFI